MGVYKVMRMLVKLLGGVYWSKKEDESGGAELFAFQNFQAFSFNFMRLFDTV